MKNTTSDQRGRLMAAGFIRVDGLTPRGDDWRKTDGVINSEAEQLGRYDSNNGRLVIVTEGGEVWLSLANYNLRLPPDLEQLRTKALDELYREFCPRGKGVRVPCSEGGDGDLSWGSIIFRLINPDWMP
ncbi:MAG: hypothetical protein NT170_02160 [Candidatus Moranbacteria bacterium]|nr:hypothetical protein [Candidatus Moranbacteria bacterium]